MLAKIEFLYQRVQCNNCSGPVVTRPDTLVVRDLNFDVDQNLFFKKREHLAQRRQNEICLQFPVLLERQVKYKAFLGLLTVRAMIKVYLTRVTPMDNK